MGRQIRVGVGREEEAIREYFWKKVFSYQKKITIMDRVSWPGGQAKDPGEEEKV